MFSIGRPQGAFSVDQLQRATSAVKNGQKDGLQNAPRSDSKGYTPTEENIISESRNCLRTLEEAYVKELADTQSSIQVSGHFNIEVRQGAAINAIRKITNDYEVPLRAAVQNQARQLESLQSFKTIHQRDMEPIYSVSPWHTVGILSTLSVTEALPNSFFFAEANPLGQLGGVGMALMISVMNVVIGFLAGFSAFRYMRHVRRTYQGIALPTGIAAVLFSVKFNVAIAEFRDALSDPKVPASNFFKLFRTFGEKLYGVPNFSDLQQTPQSTVLILVGLVIFVIALRKGILERDPYPGYADRDIQYRFAQDDVEQIENEIRNKASEVVQSFTNTVQTEAERIANLQPALKNAKQAIEVRLAALEQRREDVQRVCNSVLSMYRHANTAARASPPPAYFSEKIVIAEPYHCQTLASVVLALKQEAVAPPALPTSQALEKFARERFDFVSAEIARIQKDAMPVTTDPNHTPPVSRTSHAEATIH